MVTVDGETLGLRRGFGGRLWSGAFCFGIYRVSRLGFRQEHEQKDCENQQECRASSHG
ncbi:MAG: hypothetical protein ACI8QS_001636 [Planctomycetota bacterium]|jgi:hypothetical protein